MKKVSCIIPAYNEEERIAGVLSVVVGHPLISEVIVVDDGSSDGTAAVVGGYPQARFIALKENGGKSHAVVEGIRSASGEFILLLDADLAGLNASDITKLVEPVTQGKADISISLRGNTPLPWRWIGLDYISGERVFSKDFIVPMLGTLSSLQGFGLEVYMNKSIVGHRLRIAVVWLGTVRSAFKHRKAGEWWLLGIKKDYIRMAWIVLRVVPPWEAARQIFWMLRLRTLYY